MVPAATVREGTAIISEPALTDAGSVEATMPMVAGHTYRPFTVRTGQAAARTT